MAAMGLAVHWLVLGANASQPPRLATPGIIAVLAGVLVAVSAWIVGWFRVLRPPVSG
jgi:hypothetical protein